jgi:hypothetical protein
MTAERRPRPSVMATHPLRANAAGIDVSVSIIEMSFGGFLAESPVPFVPGTIHVFDIALEGEARVIRLSAKVVYTRRPDSATVPLYESGFSITDLDHPAVESSVHVLMAHITSVLQFG